MVMMFDIPEQFLWKELTVNMCRKWNYTAPLINSEKLPIAHLQRSKLWWSTKEKDRLAKLDLDTL